MHHELLALAGIIGALSVGTVSPGPSFVMVARTSVAASRVQGLAAALGMGAGAALFATIALLGLQAVLLAVPSLYVALKSIGGLYLAWLGYRIFAGATRPLAVDEVGREARAGAARAFWRALATQVCNPKAAVIYASVFAAFLPVAYSSFFVAALLVAVFCVEAGWYAIVALALSSQGPRAAYLRCKKWVDRSAGAVLMSLGVRLVTAAHRP